MTKRIIAIAFIFVCASIAWAILGGTIFTPHLFARCESRESGGVNLGFSTKPGAAQRLVHSNRSEV